MMRGTSFSNCSLPEVTNNNVSIYAEVCPIPTNRMNIYVDANRKNISIVSNKIKIIKPVKGNYTINELEYRAILEGLKIADFGDTIYSDSKLAVYQILGWYRINHNHLKELCNRCRLERDEKNIKIFWKRRNKNQAGMYLEREKRKQNHNKQSIL